MQSHPRSLGHPRSADWVNLSAATVPSPGYMETSWFLEFQKQVSTRVISSSLTWQRFPLAVLSHMLDMEVDKRRQSFFVCLMFFCRFLLLLTAQLAHSDFSLDLNRSRSSRLSAMPSYLNRISFWWYLEDPLSH